MYCVSFSTASNSLTEIPNQLPVVSFVTFLGQKVLTRDKKPVIYQRKEIQEGKWAGNLNHSLAPASTDIQGVNQKGMATR